MTDETRQTDAPQALDDGALDAVQGGYKHEVREHTQMGITDDVRLQGPTTGDGPRTGIISMTEGESSGV